MVNGSDALQDFDERLLIADIAHLARSVRGVQPFNGIIDIVLIGGDDSHYSTSINECLRGSESNSVSV